VNRFLYGILANASVVTLGYLIITVVPIGWWNLGDPLYQQIALSGLLGAIAATAAFLHVSLTSSTTLGPVATVVGSCAVTTVFSALVNLSKLASTADAWMSLTVVATASTGALLGGSLGVLRRE
jgi:hypothetical protein